MLHDPPDDSQELPDASEDKACGSHALGKTFGMDNFDIQLGDL